MRGLRRRSRAVAVLAGGLALVLGGPVEGAVAAEAGGARVSASASGTAAVGNCLASASTSGRYGITCAGSRYRTSFGALLAGSAPPTCWLVDPATADDTPRSGRTPRASSTRLRSAAVPAGAVVPEPTGSPTATPAPVPAEPVPADTVPTALVSTAPVPEVPVPGAPLTPEPVPTPTTRPPQEYLQICLAPPPDPRTGVPSWGTDLERSTVRVSPDDPARYPFWEELTEGQQAYADLADRREGTIQVNGLVVSPSTTPRIGQTIAFSVRNDVPPPVVARGDTMMRALPLDLTVRPYPGAEPLSCTGTGRDVEPGSTERTGADVCSYTYSRTSAGAVAGRARDTFAVTGTSRWRIQISHDRGVTWSDYLTASVPADLGLQVREVQTLVVPLTAP